MVQVGKRAICNNRLVRFEKGVYEGVPNRRESFKSLLICAPTTISQMRELGPQPLYSFIMRMLEFCKPSLQSMAEPTCGTFLEESLSDAEPRPLKDDPDVPV